MVNGYRRISVHSHEIEVPGVDPHEDVDVHLIPDTTKNVMEIRIWWRQKMVYSVAFPLSEFTVHF